MTRFEWDPEKDASNQQKHGIGFSEATELFTSDVDYLEIYDELHSDYEDRFIAIGPIRRGVVFVVWTERSPDTIRIIGARMATAYEQEQFHDHMNNEKG